MDRAELDNLLCDLLEERLSVEESDRLLQRITSEPDVARAYAEAKLREERAVERMEQRYGVRSSYRYRIDPANGKASPLAVWSPQALRSRILEADVSVGEANG